jgi:hypothetical protein
MQHPFPVNHSCGRENKRNIKNMCRKMMNFQNLPDELVLKIFNYSEINHLLTCGQVSKRIRRISRDDTLWVTANLEKKIVKTELLEMILQKGCRILNICHSTILGCLKSNIESQLKVFKFQSSSRRSCEEIHVLEELLSSCYSLQHLVMERVPVTAKMAARICKNGKTLQILNLKGSYLDVPPSYGASYHINYFQEIIQCCQELKEVDLGDEAYERDFSGDFYFLVKNIPPNVEKLRYLGAFMDHHFKILLSRCNKIKALSLEHTEMTDELLTNIRQRLNLTLEELSCRQTIPLNISFRGFLELKSMPRLKILNLYYNSCYEEYDEEEIQNLRQHLPHLMIKCFDRRLGKPLQENTT